ncbi:MAG: hypothetical protein MJA27_07660 [Pseudanabaenales cyanobacterium]|nr:hypothetical protein [Pseudanabaenales cyanobacterium]
MNDLQKGYSSNKIRRFLRRREIRITIHAKTMNTDEVSLTSLCTANATRLSAVSSA